MVQRLIELNGETGHMKEVDPKRVRRAALTVRDYILNASSEAEKKYNFRKRILPWVEKIITGTLPLPFDMISELHYLYRMISDDVYPDFPLEFRDLLAKFQLAVIGVANSPSFEKDGKHWVLEEFED
jgi:hypothetical protein